MLKRKLYRVNFFRMFWCGNPNVTTNSRRSNLSFNST